MCAPSSQGEASLRTKGRRTLLVAFATVAAMLLGATPLHADISWDLTYEFSGAWAPEGTLSVILNDTGQPADTVKLIVDAGDLVATEFVSELYLNVNPDFTPTALEINDLGGPYTVDSIEQGVDAFKADGDGKYDIHINFSTSNSNPELRLGAGDKAEFTIVGGEGFDSSDLEYLSAPAGGHGPFYVAAHVQGIGGEDDNSGWVTTPVPEASTIILFGSGLLGVLGFARGKVRSLVGR